jgi:pyruvate dehydrogenase E2 component (dihydrolipoamide acetyltransferase)
MAVEITVPRLGWNMEEGVFAGWLKESGTAVRAGDLLFSLEGDKATEDIECFDSGILCIPANAPKTGDPVRVGDVIAYLLGPGEEAPAGDKKQGVRTEPKSLPQASTPVQHQTREIGTERQPTISPRAQRVARELEVDWTQLQGTGRTGRIRERDVRAAAASGQKVPMRSVRRTIAERMVRNLQATAPVTLTTSVNATNLVNLRRQFQTAAATSHEVPSYTDFIVKLTAAALQRHPNMNARWEKEQIVVLSPIRIGIAVDTDAGLLVPVLREVDQQTLIQIAAQSRALIERARQGKLRAEEMQGGTFTITNLGAFGIDAFTPIINYPECAILGVGRIERQPVVVEDQVVAGERLTLSLTFDHRAVDGAPAARFLQSLGKLIENPGPALLA